MVMRRPMLCFPGRRARARKPAMIPRTIAPRISEISIRVRYPHPGQLSDIRLAPQPGSRLIKPRTTKAAPKGGLGQRTGGDLLSQAREGQVPSALRGLTALFGMGRGVSLSL